MTLRQWIFVCLMGTSCVSAMAWGPDGHHTVGAIADHLLVGKPAAAKVSELLGGLSLQDAAVWADCAKGIDPAKGFTYTSAGRYPEHGTGSGLVFCPLLIKAAGHRLLAPTEN